MFWMLFNESLFDLQSSSVDVFTQPTWLVVRRVFIELFTHHGVHAFQFGLCVSLLGHLLSVIFSPIPFRTSSMMISHRFPMQLFRR